MTVEVAGMKEIRRNFAKFQQLVGEEVADAVLAGGKLIETEAKQRIASRSMGETVTRYRNGGNAYSHVASRPGDAPNTDTGRLIQSVRTQPETDAVFVGTGLKYGKHLEFGTTKMKARPWLFPSYEHRRPQVVALIRRAIEQQVRNAGSN